MVGILIILLAALVLELAVQTNLISPFTVPAPSSVLREIPVLFAEENLIGFFITTMFIIFVASLLSFVIGTPLGWLLWKYEIFGKAYEGWLGAIFSAPIVLLYPIFLVLFGRGELTIIVMSFLVGVTPIILNTYVGLKNVPPVYIKVATSFGMSDGELFRKVLLPAALPSLFTGIRLSLIYTMINAVAIEFLISIGGLGYLVGDLYDRYDIPGMYAAVAFVLIASILFFYAIDQCEKRLNRK